MPLALMYSANKSAAPSCENDREYSPAALLMDKSMSPNEPESHSSDVECPTCGRDDFSSRKGMKIHHGRVHDESIAGFKRTCPVCGDSFWSKREKGTETCGPKCGGSLQSERMLGSDILTTKRKLKERYLDRQMTMQEIADEAGCSRSAVYKALNRHNITTRGRTDHNPAYKGGKETRICIECGGEFKTWPSNNEMRCSMKCYAEYRNGIFVGENAPAWKGGDYAYGTGWNEAKKETVRERDGYQCQACGMTQDEHLEERARKLPVHHIIPARQFDDAEQRNHENNLVALCVPCHKKWEGIPLRPRIE